MKTKLYRLTERVWIYPYEEERDRPNLGYIRGDKWSLAVDAGHSIAHVNAFYAALEEEDLPMPSLTILTHWHWDHTFAIHAIKGLSLANGRTNRYLLSFQERIEREGQKAFLSLHESVRREYAGGQPVVVVPADMVFSGEMVLDAGNCPVRAFQVEAPHTDDSTLVYLPGEKVLFLGDAAGGTFPTWEKDMVLARKLAGVIETMGADVCVEGHWKVVPVQDTLDDLLTED